MVIEVVLLVILLATDEDDRTVVDSSVGRLGIVRLDVYVDSDSNSVSQIVVDS